MTKKFSVFSSLSLVVFILVLTPSFGKVIDVGTARPLGMGNAFVALANDANAILWNPAGIAQIESREGLGGAALNTKVRTMTFLSYLEPSGPEMGFAGGLSYLNAKAKNIENTVWIYSIGQWVDPTIAIGVNFKYHTISYLTASDKVWAVDAGAIWKYDNNITIGVAVYDINEPKVIGYTDPRIVSVGAAYQFDPLTCITGEIYNVGDRRDPSIYNATLYRQYRFGVEHLLTPQITLRAGARASDYSVGFGIRQAQFSVDFAYMKGTEGREDETMMSLRMYF